jgi:hypothetical protein
VYASNVIHLKINTIQITDSLSRYMFHKISETPVYHGVNIHFVSAYTGSPKEFAAKSSFDYTRCGGVSTEQNISLQSYINLESKTSENIVFKFVGYLMKNCWSWSSKKRNLEVE